MTVARIRKTALSAIAALGFTLTAMVTATGAAQADDQGVDTSVNTGCPSGAVCIYPDDSWNGGNPSHVFWSYGVHQIYNQFGEHRVYNNQTGNARASQCTGSDGTDCAVLAAGYYWDADLTPINSIKLFK